MKLRSFALLATITLATPAAFAQQNGQEHGGGESTPPPPTYVAPPPVGGYAGPTYAPAPPPPYGPKTMKYEEGDPVPPGYRVEERTRTGLVVGGAILFGIPYLFTVLGASIADDLGAHNVRWLYLPVAGPFVYTTTYSCDDSSSGGCATGKTFLYLDGLAQGGGVLMFILGLSGRKMLVRNDVAEVEVMPLLGRNGNGLQLVGRF